MGKTYTIHNYYRQLSAVNHQTGLRELKMVLLRRITWVVFIAYALLMFRPVMPVVMDKLAHTFWEQQHILIVHEVNGKFHVHNELANLSHSSEKDKQVNSKAAIDEYLTASKVLFLPRKQFFTEAALFIPYLFHLALTTRTNDYPPPKISD